MRLVFGYNSVFFYFTLEVNLLKIFVLYFAIIIINEIPKLFKLKWLFGNLGSVWVFKTEAAKSAVSLSSGVQLCLWLSASLHLAWFACLSLACSSPVRTCLLCVQGEHSGYRGLALFSFEGSYLLFYCSLSFLVQTIRHVTSPRALVLEQDRVFIGSLLWHHPLPFPPVSGVWFLIKIRKCFLALSNCLYVSLLYFCCKSLHP